MKSNHILVLNGPNINLLGIREPNKYGNISLKKIIKELQIIAKKQNCMLSHVQSNAEYILINSLVQYSTNINYIIFNPASFTHTSIALRDTLLGINIPFIEVHITNIYKRELFRQKSFFSDISQGIIIGCGIEGYYLALNLILKKLNK
ncbi:type II 3-dehydroquinate dehydratase [Enterobacteriaceae endosymbiont of Neohaemonia nigricornis]|uniref:type II 3-dehydroquinate dehydratase n=1 Tax=Enterobacteriaceae endosymbiont of Neohaemonia nigricornis TaxID=2675792 RepID=UPI001449F949|nr:type II 3-dehydroquinate dehydratase [Enterobacteriaceae endosymbiont of Neohaemonia nigricornis]QJC30221.1 type II 3-dehydroquinate dehydratase [Enterobacteriaceae endosymbiont of Neohaemonia nigricornis]